MSKRCEHCNEYDIPDCGNPWCNCEDRIEELEAEKAKRDEQIQRDASSRRAMTRDGLVWLVNDQAEELKDYKKSDTRLREALEKARRLAGQGVFDAIFGVVSKALEGE